MGLDWIQVNIPQYTQGVSIRINDPAFVSPLEKGANAVVAYLVEQQGLDAARFSTVGRGDRQPIASNDTSAGRRMNRRVEIVVLPQGGHLPPEQQSGAASEPVTYTK